jgi:hypothetical protein
MLLKPDRLVRDADHPGGQIAMVISEVFRNPVADAPLAGPLMLLEGLQADSRAASCAR